MLGQQSPISAKSVAKPTLDLLDSLQKFCPKYVETLSFEELCIHRLAFLKGFSEDALILFLKHKPQSLNQKLLLTNIFQSFSILHKAQLEMYLSLLMPNVAKWIESLNALYKVYYQYILWVINFQDTQKLSEFLSSNFFIPNVDEPTKPIQFVNDENLDIRSIMLMCIECLLNYQQIASRLIKFECGSGILAFSKRLEEMPKFQSLLTNYIDIIARTINKFEYDQLTSILNNWEKAPKSAESLVYFLQNTSMPPEKFKEILVLSGLKIKIQEEDKRILTKRMQDQKKLLLTLMLKISQKLASPQYDDYESHILSLKKFELNRRLERYNQFAKILFSCFNIATRPRSHGQIPSIDAVIEGPRQVIPQFKSSSMPVLRNKNEGKDPSVLTFQYENHRISAPPPLPPKPSAAALAYLKKKQKQSL